MRRRAEVERRPRATNTVVGGPAPEDAPLRVFALRRPKPPGYLLVNVTSRSSSAVWRQLSPMLLGPVALATGRGIVRAHSVENAWQYSKVYSVGPLGQPFVDAAGEPNDAYYSWARAGWESPAAVRFPMGRGARPLYSIGQLLAAPPAGAATGAATGAPAAGAATGDATGAPAAGAAAGAAGAAGAAAGADHLGYLEARRRVYAPAYAAAAEASPAYAALVDLYASGVPIGLVDFDGWDHVGQGYSLAAALAEPRVKFGHAFVLAGMLTGERVWEE